MGGVEELVTWLTRAEHWKAEAEHWETSYLKVNSYFKEAQQNNRKILSDWEKVEKENLEAINDMRLRRDESDNARVLAEARVADLKESLELERERLSDALSYEREVSNGVRARIGLVQRPAADQKEGPLKPVSTRRTPWSVTQAEREKASREAVNKQEDHWVKKIEEVEKADAATNTEPT